MRLRTCLWVGALLAVTPCWLQADIVVSSGFGTPTINGVFSPGEWAKAGQTTFSVNTIDGPASATMYVMNDAANLYVGFTITYPTWSSVEIDFSNDNSGAFQNGDDAIGFNSSLNRFYDMFRTNLDPCSSSAPGACGFNDADYGGTVDGSGASSSAGGVTYYELSHPLNSGDTGHDFSLVPGDSVGFTLYLAQCNGDRGCYDTSFPGSSFASAFGTIVTASGPEAPEPATVGLLAAGLVGLLALRRKRAA